MRRFWEGIRRRDRKLDGKFVVDRRRLSLCLGLSLSRLELPSLCTFQLSILTSYAFRCP